MIVITNQISECMQFSINIHGKDILTVTLFFQVSEKCYFQVGIYNAKLIIWNKAMVLLGLWSILQINGNSDRQIYYQFSQYAHED